MTFEERALAAKAKLDEAVDELLDLVSTSPSAAGDLCQILNPHRTTVSSVELKEFYRSEMHQEGEDPVIDDLELTPYTHAFEKRAIAREDEPEALIVKGAVFLLLSFQPEDELKSAKNRQMALKLGG